jgi:ABC-2 type transport system ATP-binding protein
MSSVIETSNLRKHFGGKAAVKGLSLQVPEGSVFAFLGSNGAGKTTTIKMLMNIIEPSHGSAKVLGVESRELGPREFQQIGYVSENQKLPEWMTVRDLLTYCKPMYSSWDDAFCEQLLKQFRLPEDQKIKSLSRGMKMKVSLLSSLAYRPRLLVLDEPFTGLDPLARDDLIRGILELSEQRSWTIFISSHDIDEVERLADWIGILDGGDLKLVESLETLRTRFRQIHVSTASATIPTSLPSSWLVPESMGHAVRFIESDYNDHEAEGRIRKVFPNCEQIEAQPMSVREIFIALARSYQVSA